MLEVDGATLDWPLCELPAGTREGSAVTTDWPPSPGAAWKLESREVGEAVARLARLKARTPQSGDIDL